MLLDNTFILTYSDQNNYVCLQKNFINKTIRFKYFPTSAPLINVVAP